MSTLKLPSRQKNLIVLTVIAGLVLLICSLFDFLSKSKLDACIITFSFGVPLALLAFDTLIDLNNKAVYKVWLTMSVVLLLFSVLTPKIDKFKIVRTISPEQDSGINSYIIDSSTSSLKALFIFLVVYWFLNNWLKRSRGVYIVNTFKQTKWYHDEAGRKTSWFDVLLNLLLMLTIFGSCLFGW